MFLGWPFSKLFAKCWSVNKHGISEMGLPALYGHKEILVNSSLKATKRNWPWSSQKFRWAIQCHLGPLVFRIMPLFSTLTFSLPSSTPQPSIYTHMWCSCCILEELLWLLLNMWYVLNFILLSVMFRCAYCFYFVMLLFVMHFHMTCLNSSNGTMWDLYATSIELLESLILSHIANQLNLLIHEFVYWISMGECNTILSAYTKYRHLG